MLKKFVPIMCTTLSLAIVSACSSSDPNAPVASAGERIPVLSVKSDISADNVGSLPKMKVPEPWKNAFWPQAGGYPNHSMQHVALGKELTQVWSAHIGRGGSEKIPLVAQPIVVNDKVVTLDAESLIRAYDLEDGSLLWEQTAGLKKGDDTVISGGLAYGDRRLFVTTGYNELLALDLGTGDLLWRKVLSGPSQTPPSVLDGRVYVQTIDNKLTAFSVKDGQSLWDYSVVSEGTTIVGGASPAVNRDVVVGAFSSGEVTALRAANGSFAWSETLDTRSRRGGLQSIADIKALPVIDKGLLIAMNYSGQMAAIDVRSGTRLWERDLGGVNMPWVAGNMIFVLTSDHELVALNRETGLVYWVKELGVQEDVQWQGPVLAGERLLVIGSDGVALDIEAGNGQTIQTWEVGRGVTIPPIVAGGRLLLLGQNGKLEVYQ